MFSVKYLKITSRYAKALFELALELNVSPQVMNDMELLLKVCKENNDFESMLHSPIITSVKKSQVLDAIFGSHFHELSIKFMHLVVRKRREMLIDGISEQYIQLFRDFNGIKTVELKTATPLSEAEREEFKKIFKEITQSKIELEEEVSPKLIGGFIYSYDNKLFDASIRTRLKSLKEEFNINIYQKEF
ncbi:MAG: ATP synthase F1 subunit delta [Bacteroidota bacterium]